MDAEEKEDLLFDLRNAQKDIDLAYSRRLALVLKSRSEGMSNRSIGWSLGLTEAAVRAIVRRANVDETISDPKWHALSNDARELFVTLVAAGQTNMAGIIDFSPNKRATYAGSDQAKLDRDLTELESAGFLVFDPEIDEIFIPSAVQYTIKAVADYATVYASPKIMIAFGDTLERKRAEQPELPLWKNRVVLQKLNAAQKWKARA